MLAIFIYESELYLLFLYIYLNKLLYFKYKNKTILSFFKKYI